MQGLSCIRPGRRRLLAAITVCLVTALAMGAPRLAVADTTHWLNIPAQDLASALKALGAAANEQVLFSDTVVAGIRSAEVKGEYTTSAAIAILLKGSRLQADRTPSGVFLIRSSTTSSSSQEAVTDAAKPIAYTSYSGYAGAASLRLAEIDASDTPGTAPESTVTQDGNAERDDKANKGQRLEQVIVTGSRIARPDLERLEPTTVISSEFIDQRAYTNVIDALNELPAFGQPDNSLVGAQSGFGVGQSFANYFSLGSQRTLTLVDGRRFVPANSPSIFGATGNGGEQVDLNVIPTLLIDRVETIAVGGAPIYGSDAIAGTVNIILKHNFDGATIDAQYGTSEHRDADQSRVRLLLGQNFDDNRGNITISGEFAHLDGLEATQRSQYTADNTYLQPPTPSPYAYVLYGNRRLGSISTSGVPMVDDGYLNFNPNFAITNSAGQTLAFNNGHLAPYTLGQADGSGVNNIGGDGLDFAKLTTLQSPQVRINTTALGNFQVNDNVRLFAEIWYSDTRTSYPLAQGAYDTALFAPAGQVNGNLIIQANNAFLSAADQATIAQNLAAYAAASPTNPQQTSQFYLARLNEDVENGGAAADQNTRRYVLGVDGTVPIFGRDFKYEASANYGVTSNFSITPSINFQNFQNALNAVPGPNGQIICAPGYTTSPVATRSSTCSPFNPFGNGIASPAAFAYITSLATADSELTQRVLSGSVNGDLFSLPAGTVKTAFGYENRRESAGFEPDQFYQQAAGYSIPITPLSGAFTTNEVFGELLVPIISPAETVPFVHRVEFEGAVREVDHSVAGKATTWTAGLRFEPVSILQFRGNYTRAIRAPSVTEAFLPTSEAFDTASDPCDRSLINSGPNPAVRAANCAKAGITQPFSSNILNFTEPITVSGDSGLQNEIADSRTFGFVLRPLERMSLTVDYVNIDISQAIVSLNPTNVLDACYDSVSYPNAYCSKITRAPDGQITLVQTGYANAGFENFNGITTEFDWSFDVPFANTPRGLGTLDLRLNHFFENQLKQAVGSEDVTVLSGSLGNSRHRGVIDVTWNRNQLYALWQARFTGRAVWDNSLPATNTQIQGVGNWWVHNFTVGYDVGSHLNLQFVVDNVFDKQAPFPLPASPPNSTLNIPNAVESYFSGILGRYFVITAKYKL
jgi:iron complex outermembrane receptor protein